MDLEFSNFIILGLLCSLLTYVLRFILNNRILAVCFPSFMLFISFGISKFELSDFQAMIFRFFLSIIIFVLIVGWRYWFNVRRKV